MSTSCLKSLDWELGYRTMAREGRGGLKRAEKGRERRGQERAAEGRRGKRQLGKAGEVWVG